MSPTACSGGCHAIFRFLIAEESGTPGEFNGGNTTSCQEIGGRLGRNRAPRSMAKEVAEGVALGKPKLRVAFDTGYASSTAIEKATLTDEGRQP